jgi:hypothetical protein
MPTALVRTFTGDGFVVAAEGRVCNSSTGEVTQEDMQKVFQVGRQPLACSFTGAALLGRADSESGDEVLFDFMNEFRNSSQAVSVRRCSTLQQYAARVSRAVNQRLRDAIRDGNIRLPDDTPCFSEQGRAIVEIYIDGYYARTPSRIEIRFWHENQVVSEPNVITEELMPMRPAAHGIGEIAKRLTANDPSLKNYLKPVEIEGQYSQEILTAITFSKAFIEACAGPEGAKVDPKSSATINNKIHMAVITPQGGFRWLPGFEPSADTL